VTDRTPTRQSYLRRRLALIRRRGYEISTGEVPPGVRGIAAPIFDAGGEAFAVLAGGIPTNRLTARTMAVMLDAVLDGAREITSQLGGSWPLRSDRTAGSARADRSARTGG
jgi:DNA-binding IclR family transcriptional regulator